MGGNKKNNHGAHGQRESTRGGHIGPSNQEDSDNASETSVATRFDTSQPTSIVTPNIHLAVTAILIAGQMAVLCNVFFTSTDNLPHRPLNEKTFEKWIRAIESVYGDPEDFINSLKTLKMIHDDMIGNDFVLSMNQFNTNFKNVESWKENMSNHFDELTMNFSNSNSSFHDQYKHISERFDQIEKEIERVRGGSSSSSSTDTHTPNEELSTLAVNLEKKFHEFKNDTERTLHGHTGQIAVIQKEKRHIQREVESVKKGFLENKQKTDEKLTEHQIWIKDVQVDLKTLTDKVNQDKAETVQTLENHSDRLQKTEEDLETVKNRLNTKDDEVKDLTERVRQNKKATDITTARQDDTINHIVDTWLPDIETIVDKNKREIEAHGDLATSRHSDFEKYRDEMKAWQDLTSYKLSVSTERSDEMSKKEVLHDVSLYIGLLSIGCCGLMFMMMLKGKGSLRTSEIRTKGIGKQSRPRENNDIYHLAWEGPMENSVCVVTFHSETERQHAEETRSVFESVGATSPTIHIRVIRRHTDIQDLPGSRVFLVFVDFNERNVILEDPSKGLGDLRVTTVRSLWNFGGDVTVIYCRDQGSRNLGGDLFNRDLSSIYSQNELSKLKNQQRMLSIFEGFSDVQKQHCRNFINRLLGRV